MAYVKKHTIRDLKSSTAAQDIDDNFDAIFATLRGLQNQIGGISGEAGEDGKDGISIVGLQGEDGEDGPPGPPGPQGIAGAAGAIGAGGPAGPLTLGPMGLNGEDGDDGYPIPGPRGETGATGAAGAGASWALIEERTMTGNANEDFINLSTYSEILVILRDVTQSASGILSLRVSTDNGSTFLTASGDYVDIAAAGTEADGTRLSFHSTSTTAARSGGIILRGFDLTTMKSGSNLNITDFFVIPTTTALNAVRVFGSAGGNLNAGTVYVYGR